MTEQSRQLAAIMYTDIVGYTSMMQHDEPDTVRRLDHHRYILEDRIEKCHGTLLQYYGDGSLSIFPSAYDAINCAMEIQKEVCTKVEIPLRIGIHLGEILFKGDTVYGDGVNIASRIQSLGVAGSILISEPVYQQIRNQPEFKTVPLGSFDLKNVDIPVQIYAIANKGCRIPRKDEMPDARQDITKEGPIHRIIKKYTWLAAVLIFSMAIVSFFLIKNKIISSKPFDPPPKSIAVLPFVNMSNDPDQEYFSEGVTEDILNHLTKISDLQVKSRTSTQLYKNSAKLMPQIGRELNVSYILEGSVRKSGNTVRVVVQLIDVKNDVHTWSETFDREIKEIFSIQSEIAIEIANVLQAKLSQTERQHLNKKGIPMDITAYDYALRAREIFRNWNDEKDLENALQLLEQAVQLDPTYAEGYTMIGNILHYGMRNFGVPTQLWINEALHMAETAIKLDSTLAEAYLLRANILFNMSGRNEEAQNDLQKAYLFDPGNFEVLSSLGYKLLMDGQYKKGAMLVVKALETGYSRKDPEFYTAWGYLYMHLEDYPVAEELFKQGSKLAPGWATPYLHLGKLYFEWGKYDLSIDNLQSALNINPSDQDFIDAIAWSYLMKGNLEKAAEYWSKYTDLERQFTDKSQYVPFRHRLAYVYWKMGDKEKANELFMEELHLDLEMQQGKRGFGAWSKGSFYYDLAIVNAFLGNREEAYSWLDSAKTKGFFSLWHLQNDPLLENIRHESRFRQIVRELKAKKEEEINAYREVLNEHSKSLPV